MSCEITTYEKNIRDKELKLLEKECGEKRIKLFDIELKKDDYHNNFNMNKLSNKHENIYNNLLLMEDKLLSDIDILEMKIQKIYDEINGIEDYDTHTVIGDQVYLD